MAVTASADLPLYLQMSRYTKGSKAVLELRTKQYLAEQANEAEKPATAATGTTNSATSSAISDDELTTASINKKESLSFDALLDAINPLQHIPGVSTLYREITGDKLDPAARIVGGGLFGGPLGAGISLVESLIEEASGLDVGGHVASWFSDKPSAAPAAATALAAKPDVTPDIAHTPVTPASNPTSTPIPTLSPEMFNALLTENQLDMSRPSAAFVPPAPPASKPPIPALVAETKPVALGEFAAAMERGLDLYQDESE
ncbi:MAG: hypothetical protein RLN89_07760 [Parvibaculum sp.]